MTHTQTRIIATRPRAVPISELEMGDKFIFPGYIAKMCMRVSDDDSVMTVAVVNLETGELTSLGCTHTVCPCSEVTITHRLSEEEK